jgi:hypothetical protein
MKEGHDGSGLGLVLKDLGGEFEELKNFPILSGICSGNSVNILDEFMQAQGFKLMHSWSPSIKQVAGINPRGHYFAKVYDYPVHFRRRSMQERETLLLNTRLALRELGEKDSSIFVFSFYPMSYLLKRLATHCRLESSSGLTRIL